MSYVPHSKFLKSYSFVLIALIVIAMLYHHNWLLFLLLQIMGISTLFFKTRWHACIHSKNTRVRNWPGKGSLGPNSIPGQPWPGNQSTWHGMWPRAGSIWLMWITDVSYRGEKNKNKLSSLQKADQFPGHIWPGMEFGPSGPFFRVTLTRVFLECNI